MNMAKPRLMVKIVQQYLIVVKFMARERLVADKWGV